MHPLSVYGFDKQRKETVMSENDQNFSPDPTDSAESTESLDSGVKKTHLRSRVLLIIGIVLLSLLLPPVIAAAHRRAAPAARGGTDTDRLPRFGICHTGAGGYDCAGSGRHDSRRAG